MKKLTCLAILFFLSGCIDHFTVPSEEALKRPFPPLDERVETQLISPALSYGRLEKEGIAVLAVLKGGPLGFRLNAAFEFFQGLRFYFPDLRVVPYRDVIQRVRDTHQFARYNNFVKNYELTRIMDLAELKTLGEIQGLRYFFIGQVVSNDKHTATQTMILDEDGVGEKISAVSSGPAHIPFEVQKEVEILGEVWDSKCGQVLWIGTSRARVTEAVEHERVRVEDLIISVTRKLIGAFDTAVKMHRRPDSLPDC